LRHASITNGAEDHFVALIDLRHLPTTRSDPMNREFNPNPPTTHAVAAGTALLTTVAVLFAIESLAGQIYVQEERLAGTQQAVVAHHDPATQPAATGQPRETGPHQEQRAAANG
jgi:hypothetical protein